VNLKSLGFTLIIPSVFIIIIIDIHADHFFVELEIHDPFFIIIEIHDRFISIIKIHDLIQKGQKNNKTSHDVNLENCTEHSAT
jgi:hypothetical protein